MPGNPRQPHNDEIVSPKAHIAKPSGPIPVVAVMNGSRVVIGTGALDNATGVFTTTFNDTPEAQNILQSFAKKGTYSLPVRVSEVECITPDQQPDPSNLVEHARVELEKIGEEPDTIVGYLSIIQAFADMGHSGGSASVAIPVINSLLRFENISPLTNNPDEWMYIAEDTWGASGGIWQSRRNPEAFSNDGGLHYYLLSDGANNLNRTPLYEAADG